MATESETAALSLEEVYLPVLACCSYEERFKLGQLFRDRKVFWKWMCQRICEERFLFLDESIAAADKDVDFCELFVTQLWPSRNAFVLGLGEDALLPAAECFDKL